MTLRSSRNKPKPPFGFVILCPDKDLKGLKTTVKSIDVSYPGFSHVCVVGKDASKEELKEMRSISDTYRGKDTISSLINTGMKKTTTDWNVIVFSGSWLKTIIYQKFNLFVKDPKDIFFPVIENRYYFFEGSMNGIIIHKKTFEEVGDFASSPILTQGVDELETVKLFWSLDAVEKGCTFKGIVGMRVN